MTLATSIIQQAFREGNLIPVGKSPSTDQQTEALAQLTRLVRGILGYKMGENLSDWLVPQPQRTSPVSSNFPQFPSYPTYLSSAIYTNPNNNQRIVYGGTNQVVYFSQKPNPGAQMAVVQASGAGDTGTTGNTLTLDGNGFFIQDPADQLFKKQVVLTFSSVTPFTPARWFYRDDLAQWMLVQDLTAGSGSAGTDNLPYPPEFDDFFICALNKRLAPRYNKITARETIETALQTESAFLARYRQPTDSVYGSDNFPRSYQSYMAGQWWW